MAAQSTPPESLRSIAAEVPLPESDLPAGGPLLLSAGQVAKLLGFGRRTVWRLASTGELPAPIKIGGATRWRRREIEEFLDAL